MRIIFPLICFTLFINGCSNQKDRNDVIRFETKVNTIDEVFTLCPTALNYTVGHLVLVNNCSDSVLQVINIDNWEENWVGRKGDDPLGVGELDLLKPTTFNGKLNFVDFQKRQTIELEVENEIKINIIERLPSKILVWENLVRSEDNWIFNDLSGDNFLTILERNQISSINEFFKPIIQQDITPKVKPYIYYNTMNYQPKKSLLVSAMRFFPYISIFDLKSNRVLELNNSQSEISPQFNLDNGMPSDDFAQWWYLQVDSNEDYIYALRANTTVKDLMNQIDFQPILEIYNWDLQLKAEIKFNKSFGSLAYDFTNLRIYGLSYGSQDHLLSYSEIPIELEGFFKNHD